MMFEDRIITITDALGTFQAVVTGEALSVLSRARSGPEDADELIEANRAIIEQVASWKREADEGEPDGSVRIAAFDLEDDDGGFEVLRRANTGSGQ